MSLTEQTICCNSTQFVENEIHALPDTLVTNTPSVKMLCPQNKILVPKFSQQHNMLICCSIEDRPCFWVSRTAVYRRVTKDCWSKNDIRQLVSALSKVILPSWRWPLYLTFRWPCIVINSYNKTNQMHSFLKFIFGIKLRMFRTVPLSIIRSYSL
jgi:hypothetical protein